MSCRRPALPRHVRDSSISRMAHADALVVSARCGDTTAAASPRRPETNRAGCWTSESTRLVMSRSGACVSRRVQARVAGRGWARDGPRPRCKDAWAARCAPPESRWERHLRTGGRLRPAVPAQCHRIHVGARPCAASCSATPQCAGHVGDASLRPRVLARTAAPEPLIGEGRPPVSVAPASSDAWSGCRSDRDTNLGRSDSATWGEARRLAT
jgi:hypothetical protein